MDRSRLGRIAKAYLFSIGIWSALSLLTGWNYLIFDQSANIQSTLVDMMLVAEARGLAYALLTPPIFFIVRHYSFGTRWRARYLIAYLLGAPLFMILCACLRWAICPPWSSTLQHFLTRDTTSPLELVRNGFADLIYIYVAIILAAHAYDYFERARTQDLERAKFQEALTASELHALKMQIHPHFLFNTLHGISTLMDSDKRSAQAMIVKLSNLLRTALDHSGSDLIPLDEELRFTSEYLDIEKMRFGSRLTVTRSIDPGTLRCLVPQLILQPLVENAIRHGIGSSRENGWLEISAQPVERMLELRIRNSVGSTKPKGAGVGLRNTKARLNYLYAGEASIHFTVDVDQTATATVLLPNLEAHARNGAEARAKAGLEDGDGKYARVDY
jgi:two-component system, LytTR family, sensor kinase